MNSQIVLCACAYDSQKNMIGFAMIVYQLIDINGSNDDEDFYYLSRMMIDHRYQGFSFGKQALSEVKNRIKTFPSGSASALILSYSFTSHVDYSMYKSVGFQEVKVKDTEGDALFSD